VKAYDGPPILAFAIRIIAARVRGSRQQAPPPQPTAEQVRIRAEAKAREEAEWFAWYQATSQLAKQQAEAGMNFSDAWDALVKYQQAHPDDPAVVGTRAWRASLKPTGESLTDGDKIYHGPPRHVRGAGGDQDNNTNSNPSLTGVG